MAMKNVFGKLFRSDDKAGTEQSAGAPKTLGTQVSSPKRGLPAPTVLLTRWQTEKAVTAEAMGQYTFVVPQRTAKGMVARAFVALTGVKPARIAMGWVMPRRSQRGRVRKRLKKAVVTVPKGATVNLPVTEQTKKGTIKHDKAR